MNKCIVVTECAIEHNNKFLIIKPTPGKHSEGLLTFPGGKFEISDGNTNNDAIKQEVKREILEEVGLNLIDPIHYVTTSYFIDSKINQHAVGIIYHCKLDKTKIDITISEREIAEYYWMTYDEIISADNCSAWLLRYMKAIKNQEMLLL